MDVLSIPATRPLLMWFCPPRRLAEHLQCMLLGKLVQNAILRPYPLHFDSVNLRHPRNLHFNDLALRNNDLYSTNSLLGSEYIDSTFSKTPLLTTSRRNLDYVHPCGISYSFLCLGLVSCSYPVECFIVFEFSYTGIVPGWLLVGERYTQGRYEYLRITCIVLAITRHTHLHSMF